jgi:DNA-binding winged helix-turn-helix (wHTH) protein
MRARCYAFGPFRVDVGKRLLKRDDVPVPLTPKAFDILVLFLQHRGEVVEKDDLVREIWRGQVVEENNIARHISTLRKALDDGPGMHRWIATIPGRGYQFINSPVMCRNPPRFLNWVATPANRPTHPGSRSNRAWMSPALPLRPVLHVCGAPPSWSVARSRRRWWPRTSSAHEEVASVYPPRRVRFGN